MSNKLFDLLEDMDRHERPMSKEEILKPPFGYPGGKTKTAKYIIEHLPYRGMYIEPFGGSAAILLARRSSKLEVFNDRYAGVTDFYRCLRDKELTERLCRWLDLNVHSKEEWVRCHDTWENTYDPVERAARWYYMTVYSFGQMGRNFGRATSTSGVFSGKIKKKLPLFPILHDRFKKVQVENRDALECLKDYDNLDAVFYLDPPYVEAYSGAHKHTMTQDTHRRMLDIIFGMRAFVAVSGYPNPLYENQDWDDRIEWESFISIQAPGKSDRTFTKEVLWIKK